MKRAPGLAIGLALMVAGCGDGARSGNAAAPKVEPSKPNPFHERLLALDETDRGLALRRAVQDNGGSCRRIVSSAYQEEYKGMRMWTLRCEGKRDWAVFVGAAGRVQTRTCADNAKLGLPVCRLG